MLFMPDEIRTVSSGCPGKDYGRLRAYNFYTGEIIWDRGSCTDYVGMFTGQESLAFGFEKLFVADEGFTTSDDAQLHAVNPENGDVIWSRTDLGYHISTSPIISQNLVIIGADYILYGLDPETGSTIWSTDFSTQFGHGSFEQEMALLSYTDELYVLRYQSSFGQRLHRVDADNGSILWSTNSLGSNPGVSFPTAFESGVIVGSDDTFYRFDLNGNQVWSYEIEGSVSGGSAIGFGDDGNEKIILTWSHYPSPFDVRMSSLNLEDGTEDFTTSIETYGNQLASPLVVQDKIVVTTYFAKLKVFDLNSGNELWNSGQYDPGGSSVTPMFFDGRITVVGKNGKIFQHNFSN